MAVRAERSSYEFARTLIAARRAVAGAHGPETTSRYEFPYGDFENVQRCAALAAESRAGAYDHVEIEVAAAHLHGTLDPCGDGGRRAPALTGGGPELPPAPSTVPTGKERA